MNRYSNAAGTKDWLEATKNMQLRAYVEGEEEQQEAEATPKGGEPLFGTHLREAIEVIKDLRRA